VANLLATLLTVSTTPATLLLEELAHTQIRIEVLGRADRELTAAEHYRLDAGPSTPGHHRTGLLRTASDMVAAETSLVIVPQRIPLHARAALASTSIPVGKILASLGVPPGTVKYARLLPADRVRRPPSRAGNQSRPSLPGTSVRSRGRGLTSLDSTNARHS